MVTDSSFYFVLASFLCLSPELQKQKRRIGNLVKFGTKSPEEEEQEKRELLMQQYLEKGFSPDQILAITLNEQMINERDMELQRI